MLNNFFLTAISVTELHFQYIFFFKSSIHSLVLKKSLFLAWMDMSVFLLLDDRSGGSGILQISVSLLIDPHTFVIVTKPFTTKNDK